MIVTGEITEKWIALASLSRQQILFQKQLQLQKKLLEIIKLRFPNGLASALDIYQQKQAIAKLDAALVPLAGKQQTLLRQLAFLVGKASLGDLYQVPTQLPFLDTLPETGLPIDLLAARPDVRATGLRLKATEWEVTAARADRLPALKLTASQSYSSSAIDSLFDNWLLNLAANVTGPIFDGNRRALEVERTKKVVEERLAQYRKTVFSAVKEVEDALADEKQYADTLDLLREQIALSERTVREARSRYLNGSSDFLNVLKEELTSMQLQQDAILAQEQMTIARVHLHKALGGEAWLDELVQEKGPYATSKQ
jgi:outer membrane protein TolC